MIPVLVDTSWIVGLIDRSERSHAACVGAAEQIAAPLVTCEAVLAEACHLLRGMPAGRDAILENVENGALEVPFRLSAVAKPVRALMKKYVRVPMDFADACLVHLADELGTGRILTLDSDFRVYRWRRTRPFELMLDF